jgi:hypothetical protein
MLRTTRRNFEDAYRYHRKVSDIPQDQRSVSHVLLLIYAVECGIKALLMRNMKAKSWDDLQVNGVCGNSGHDLAEGLKGLGLSARLTVSRRRTVRDRDGRQEDVPPPRLHEACRYAIPLEDPDFDQMQGQLEQVLAWLKTQLGG